MRRLAAALLCATIAVAPIVACQRGGTSTTAENKAAEGRDYLEKNKKAEGVKTTESGLQYKVLHPGPETGGHPATGDMVLVHYELSLPDGQVMESTFTEGRPTHFTVGQVIPGWNEALTLMRPGDEWMLYIPSDLAYGEKPEEKGGRGLPPNQTLIFRVQLLDFVSAR